MAHRSGGAVSNRASENSTEKKEERKRKKNTEDRVDIILKLHKRNSGSEKKGG